jgi:PST family polysaccharide transporter
VPFLLFSYPLSVSDSSTIAERPQYEQSTPAGLIHSAGAASASTLWRMVVMFGTAMLLKRFILPSEWALWTWAEPTFALIALVRDLGIPGHLVRHDRRPWGNYLGLQLGWGAVLSLLVAVLAPLLALSFEGRGDDTVAALRLLCLFLFIQGLGSVPLTYFEASQRIIRTVPAELARNSVFALVAIGLAVYGYGVWSILIAHVVGATVYTAMLWLAMRGSRSYPQPFELRFEGAATWPLILASLPLMVLSLFEIGVLNLEPLLLASRVPAEALGLAGHALMLLYLLSRQMADAAGRAVYPALVRHRNDPERAFEIFRIATLFLLTFVTAAAFGLHLNARLAALLMAFGRAEWGGAADYLAVAAFVPFLRPLTMFGREFLLVFYRDRLLIAYTLGNLLSLGALGLWLTRQHGAIGMAWASYFPLGTVLLAWGLHQLSPASFRKLIGNILELYLIGALCFAPAFLVSPEHSWLRLSISLLLAGLFVTFALRRHRAAYRNFLASD